MSGKGDMILEQLVKESGAVDVSKFIIALESIQVTVKMLLDDIKSGYGVSRLVEQHMENLNEADDLITRTSLDLDDDFHSGWAR